MYTVHEVMKKTGVSIRALHHYDEIGLLKPARVTDAGYRLYDEEAILRLSEILFYKEIGFSLSEIKNILNSPDYDRKEALNQQIRLLEIKLERAGQVLNLARKMRDEGEMHMSFDAFDTKKEDAYRQEVKNRWGETEAYKAYEKKEKAGADFRDAGGRLMEMMASFGEIRHLSPSCAEAKEKVKALQKFISDHFYPCTDEILSGLGEMYVSDERFKKNIDTAGGEGTAEFVRSAIRAQIRNE
ncbi:MAG: MerR family transcriptional regulator [Clostridia bacterium]|nr:MerR family transcriptional regulator [Clostridia bacterium]